MVKYTPLNVMKAVIGSAAILEGVMTLDSLFRSGPVKDVISNQFILPINNEVILTFSITGYFLWDIVKKYIEYQPLLQK